MELKNSLSVGGACPVDENTLYYVHITVRDEEGSLSLMLLVCLPGCHYFQVFGAVHAFSND